MHDITLTPRTPLEGLDIRIGDTVLREVTDMALAALCVPLGNEVMVGRALSRGFGLAMPDHGSATQCGACHAARSAPDQLFLFLGNRPDGALDDVMQAFEGVAYVTDQTDAWVFCALNGPGVHAALERICPLDLDDNAFPVGAYGRTVMEHMGTALLRTARDAFVLHSARSSARSFAQMLERALRDTQAP